MVWNWIFWVFKHDLFNNVPCSFMFKSFQVKFLILLLLKMFFLQVDVNSRIWYEIFPTKTSEGLLYLINTSPVLSLLWTLSILIWIGNDCINFHFLFVLSFIIFRNFDCVLILLLEGNKPVLTTWWWVEIVWFCVWKDFLLDIFEKINEMIFSIVGMWMIWALIGSFLAFRIDWKAEFFFWVVWWDCFEERAGKLWIWAWSAICCWFWQWFRGLDFWDDYVESFLLGEFRLDLRDLKLKAFVQRWPIMRLGHFFMEKGAWALHGILL